jgi:DNA-binding CsgD family transcriptional regulator/predicted ester cyclase
VSEEKLVADFFEALWISKDINIINEKCSNDIVIHHYNRVRVGKNEKIQIAKSWFDAFPNKDDVKIEELNKVGGVFQIKWCGTAKHEGMFWDLPPTGKVVNYNGICFFKVKDHFIVEYQTESNTRMNLIGLGSIPYNSDDNNNHQKANEDIFSKIKNFCKLNLTNREMSVASLWFSGYSVKESARVLQLSPRTVDEYRRRIKDTMNVVNKKNLYAFFRDKNALDLFLDFSEQLIISKK